MIQTKQVGDNMLSPVLSTSLLGDRIFWPFQIVTFLMGHTPGLKANLFLFQHMPDDVRGYGFTVSSGCLLFEPGITTLGQNCCFSSGNFVTQGN